MPHFNDQGQETWVCQKGGHICTGESHWVERGSRTSQELGGVVGNVCHWCYVPAKQLPEVERCVMKRYGKDITKRCILPYHHVQPNHQTECKFE